jgi:flagella basal body P-ring formation protein FlgA
MPVLLLTVALSLAAAPAAGADAPVDRARAAIAAAVVERLGAVEAIEVEILHAPAELAAAETPLTATPTAGARLGQPIRFALKPAGGRPFSVVVRVTAIVGHAIATHALGRDVALTSADVEWRRARIDGVLFQTLPTLDDVLSARTRRSIAAGEVLTRSALLQPFAVRAGDTVALTVRAGAIEVRGVGRAVSSGFVGDVIRIMPPGTRQPSRARIVGPAAVEMVR